MAGRVALLACVMLAGCTTPRAVSSFGEVQQASEDGQITLVPISAATMPAPDAVAAPGFPPSILQAGDYGALDVLRPGDRVQVRIWESGAAPVFSGSGGVADLGEMAVDGSGRISIPYVGPIRVAGSSAASAEQAIAARLRKVVLRPQVSVRVVEKRSSLVSVLGNAGKSGSYTLETGRTRLSELLAEAAPDQENPEMLAVTVRRGNEGGTVRLSDIYSNPALDVALRPGDSVILQDVVENITVLGAAGVQGRVPVPERDFTLVEALGLARGLNPDAADPRAVFVLRPSAIPGEPPIVYQFDMRQPQVIALANRFELQNDDAILVSSSSWAQTRQILSAFAQSMATVRSAATIPVP